MTETTDDSRKGPTIGGALTAAAYAAAGLSFYLYSGRAEGFVSPRLGPVLVTLTSVPLLFYLGMAPTFHFRRPGRRNRWLIMTGIIVGYLLIVAGYRLDRQLTADTMDQGDLLAIALEDHKRASGIYPQSLEQLDGPLPAPALVGAIFTYQPVDGGYTLAFPSVAFMQCERGATDSTWRCND